MQKKLIDEAINVNEKSLKLNNQFLVIFSECVIFFFL